MRNALLVSSWLSFMIGLLPPALADDAAGEEALAVDPDLADALAADPVEQKKPAPSAMAFNPKMSLILTTSFAWFSEADHIAQGGHSPTADGFNLQGLEFAASASVDPYFEFKMAAQLGHMELEEAYLTTINMPLIQLRSGLFMAPFGRQNPRHLHQWSFANPSLAHSRFMHAEHFSGLGAEASMLLPLPWYLMIKAAGFSTHSGAMLRSASFGPPEEEAVEAGHDEHLHEEGGVLDGPEDLVYIGRLETFFELSDDWSLMTGLSAAFGQSPYADKAWVGLYGADLYCKWRPISSGQGDLAVALTLEYMFRNTGLEGNRAQDHGGYGQLDLQLSKRFLLGLRAGTTSWWRGPIPAESGLDDWQWRGSAVATFLPTHYSKVLLQFDSGMDRGAHHPYHALFLLVEVSAGAHGVHQF